MVENLAKEYGDKVAVFADQDYYSFPHIHKLAQVFIHTNVVRSEANLKLEYFHKTV